MIYTKEDLLDLGIKNGDIYIEWLNKYSAKFNVNTPDRIIAFLMNVFHETGDLRYVEEIASGIDYNNRVDLGNTHFNDGVKFKGRGWAMTTGRYNYTELTAWCKLNGYTNIDFVKYPEKLKEPQWAVLSAFWFWEKNRLALYADKRLFKEVASIWNTGKPDNRQINGLEDRMRKAKVIETWLKKLITG